MRGWNGSCFQASHFYFLGLDLGGYFLIDVLVPARADVAGIELCSVILSELGFSEELYESYLSNL